MGLPIYRTTTNQSQDQVGCPTCGQSDDISNHIKSPAIRFEDYPQVQKREGKFDFSRVDCFSNKDRGTINDAEPDKMIYVYYKPEADSKRGIATYFDQNKENVIIQNAEIHTVHHETGCHEELKALVGPAEPHSLQEFDETTLSLVGRVPSQR